MDSFPSILKALGSVDEVARSLHVTPDAVRKMAQRESIPPRHWPQLMKMADAAGFNLTFDRLARIATGSTA